MFPSAEFIVHDFTGSINDHEKIAVVRDDLMSNGFSVVRLYEKDCEKMVSYERGIDTLAKQLRADGGTPHCAKGMGGITKVYGAGCHPISAEVRLDDRARELQSRLYGLNPEDVMSGWDAVAIVGKDGIRTKKRKIPTDPKDAFFYGTGGTLPPHVDIDPDGKTVGASTERKMFNLHPIFPYVIQSQFVCKSVPKGGSTFVIAPGGYADAMPSNVLFNGGRDYAPCTDEGYIHFHGKWRSVEAERGSLILWISRAPHANKLANCGVDPERRVVFISWQDRRLVDDTERNLLKKRKLEAVYSGATTDHWSTQIPKLHRGSHYSNKNQQTRVLYTSANPPNYSEELSSKIESAF